MGNTFSIVIRVQDGMILSIQLEIEDIEVLLDTLGIGGLGQRDGSQLNLKLESIMRDPVEHKA